MNMAVIENDTVINTISIDETNIESFSALIQKELYPADEYGLSIGDYRENGLWYRNGIEMRARR
jgi:hypothetical protein